MDRRRLQIGLEAGVQAQNELLEVNCFNTAWMSRIHERQGHLFLPADDMITDEAKVTLELSLLHHPFGWLEASNSNVVRRRLFEASDLIFTGHEHMEATLDTELVSHGNSSVHEALPFLADGADNEGFSAVFLETDSKQKVQIDFIWQEHEFLPYQQGCTH